jgi:hypothetical protein
VDDDFRIDGDYTTDCASADASFQLTESHWKWMCEGYRRQDIFAKPPRLVLNNVNEADYGWAKELFKQNCVLCGARFTVNNKPTLDRMDNDLPHTKDNCQPMCLYCNVVKGKKKDIDVVRLHVQLRNFALKHGYPMTLNSDYQSAYELLRD